MNKLSIKYRKNNHQAAFHDDVATKYLHLSGGYGSGKTFALIQKLFQLSIKNRHLPGGLVCPSFPEFKRDVKELMEEICTANRIKYFYHQTDHWYLFPWSRGKVYVATAEKQLKGPNWAFAAINELTLIPFERYKEVRARVRLKKSKYPQIASCGTPEGLLTGYYDFLIENPKENVKVIYGSTKDNIHNLNSDYLDTLRDAYDERALAAYMEGKFINTLGNRFYYAYDETCQDINMVEDSNAPCLLSLDYNVNPMVGTIWQWQNDGSLGAVGQVVMKDNANTNTYCGMLKDADYTPERVAVYPDPSGNSRSTKGQPDNTVMRNNGYYNLKVRSHAPPFRKRQLNVNNLLSKRRLKVNPKLAPALHRDLLLCTQDQETLEKEKSSPELTHASDGMDYMCDIEFPFSGTKPMGSVIKVR